MTEKTVTDKATTPNHNPKIGGLVSVATRASLPGEKDHIAQMKTCTTLSTIPGKMAMEDIKSRDL